MNHLQSIAIIILALLLLPSPSTAQLYFSSDGAEIHYNMSGEGEAVILLHGFTENIEVAWEQAITGKEDSNVFQTLANDFLVIAIDQRGHGRSAKPIGQDHYGAAMVEDIANLMDYLGVEQAHIVGYSMGAVIAANYLATYEDRVKSITMIGGIPIGQEAYQSNPEFQLVNLATTDCLYSNCGINPLIDFVLPGDQPREMLDAISRELLTGQNRIALASCLLGFVDLLQMDLGSILKSDKPMQIIMGEYDPFNAFLLPFKEQSPTVIDVLNSVTHIDILSKQEMWGLLANFLKSNA